MRKKITEYFKDISLNDWDGETFWSFRAFINNLDIPDEATMSNEYGESYASISIRRDETDEEYEKRLDDESRKRAASLQYQEENEKKEYERLKAKYENGSRME